MIVRTLATAGLVVQATQPKFCLPTADKREAGSIQIYPVVNDFATAVKRSRGGLHLLVGAAVINHDVAIYATLGTVVIVSTHAENA